MDQFSFDAVFQGKLASLILRDAAVASSWRFLIKPEYFADPIVQRLIRWNQQYSDQYGTQATLEVLRWYIGNTAETDRKFADQVNVAYQWLDFLIQQQVPDRDFILDQVKKFVSVQEYKLAVLQAVDLIKDPDRVGEIPDIIQGTRDKLSQTTGDIGIRGIGMSAEERFDVMFRQPVRNTIETFWPSLNEVGAVPARGELFVVAAPPNVGKSWGLINLTASAVGQSKFVVHYTLEMSALITLHRAYSILTARPVSELESDPAGLEGIISQYRQAGSEFVVKYFPTESITINDLRDHIAMVISVTGRKPDMVVVDYADLIRVDDKSKEDTRHQLASIYLGLRRIAGELDIAVATATQTNRASLAKEVISIGDLAEAFAKAAIADVIVGLCQTATEELNQQARWFVAKNRANPKGITAHLSVDYARGIMREQQSMSLNDPNASALGNPSLGLGFTPILPEDS